MDDVYLLNNPFTFQAMEKHSAYCAMMRLGLRVPDTWLIPHKNPPENERFERTAERYNLPFDLTEIAAQIGYPLYMKPFDGGQWVGVTRIRDAAELHAVYDASGERLMHLQAAVEDFDVFARSLSIGAETMVMHFDPDRPLHDRYQVDHDFLSPGARRGGRHDQPARQRVLPLGVQLLRDDRQGRRGVPDRLRERVAGRRADEPPLLLPVGDPGARPLERLLRRHRPAMRIDQDLRALLRDRRPDDLSYEEKLARVPAARRRLLPGRRLRGVLRETPPAPRRALVTTSRARSSTAARRRPCSRRLPAPTSTSSSSPTTAGSSAPWARDAEKRLGPGNRAVATLTHELSRRSAVVVAAELAAVVVVAVALLVELRRVLDLLLRPIDEDGFGVVVDPLDRRRPGASPSCRRSRGRCRRRGGWRRRRSWPRRPCRSRRRVASTE